MPWCIVKKADYSGLHTPNICRRSGSRKRKGMLDTWRRLGVPLASESSPTLPPPPPPPEPTPDWPSIWEDPSDCWDKETYERERHRRGKPGKSIRWQKCVFIIYSVVTLGLKPNMPITISCNVPYLKELRSAYNPKSEHIQFTHIFQQSKTGNTST